MKIRKRFFLPLAALLLGLLALMLATRAATDTLAQREAHFRQGVAMMTLTLNEEQRRHTAAVLADMARLRAQLRTAAGSMSTALENLFSGQPLPPAEREKAVHSILAWQAGDGQWAGVRLGPKMLHNFPADWQGELIPQDVAGRDLETVLRELPLGGDYLLFSVATPQGRETLLGRLQGLRHDASGQERGDAHLLSLVRASGLQAQEDSHRTAVLELAAARLNQMSLPGGVGVGLLDSSNALLAYAGNGMEEQAFLEAASMLDERRRESTLTVRGDSGELLVTSLPVNAQKWRMVAVMPTNSGMLGLWMGMMAVGTALVAAGLGVRAWQARKKLHARARRTWPC